MLLTSLLICDTLLF